MGAIEHLTISLPSAMADRVRAWVDTGDFPNAEAVVLDALLAFGGPQDAREDAELERWMRTEVAAALDEFDRDPSSGLSADQVLAVIAADRAAAESQG